MKWIIQITVILIIRIKYPVAGYTFGTRHNKGAFQEHKENSPSAASQILENSWFQQYKSYEPIKETEISTFDIKDQKYHQYWPNQETKIVEEQQTYYHYKPNKESKFNAIVDEQKSYTKKQKDYYPIWFNNTNKSPYQVMLIGKSYLEDRFLCGGTLISREWILTAAHCTSGIYEFEVHLGAQTFDDYTEQGRLIFDTSDFIIHENYYPYYALNDIALIRLPQKIKFTDKIQPVRLPKQRDLLFVDEHAIASGWGSNGANMTSNKLEYAELKVISNKLCKRYFNKLIIHESTLCAWGINNANVCTGDSGGPLILKGTRTLIALTSFGNTGGCHMMMPGGFSRITTYLDWITTKTGVKP